MQGQFHEEHWGDAILRLEKVDYERFGCSLFRFFREMVPLIK